MVISAHNIANRLLLTACLINLIICPIDLRACPTQQHGARFYPATEAMQVRNPNYSGAISRELRWQITRLLSTRRNATLSSPESNAPLKFASIKELLVFIAAENSHQVFPNGIRLLDFAETYGIHATYYLLRELDATGFLIDSNSLLSMPRKGPVTYVSPYGNVFVKTAAKAANAALGTSVFKITAFPVALFFATLEAFTTADREHQWNRYEGEEGLASLAQELAVQFPAYSLYLENFYTLFSTKAAIAVLRTDFPDLQLRWPNIGLSLKVMQASSQEILKNPMTYRCSVGSIRLAKFLTQSHLGTPHLQDLWRIFGTHRAEKNIQAFGGLPLYGGPLGWKEITFSLNDLEFAGHTLWADPSRYKGIEGMLLLATELAAEERLGNPHQLYTAFGKPEAIEILREIIPAEDWDSEKEHLVRSLEWDDINIPFTLLIATAKEIQQQRKDYQDVDGLIRLCVELRSRFPKDKIHPGVIFRAFGGAKGLSLVTIITGKDAAPLYDNHDRIITTMQWSSVTMPLEKMKKVADMIIKNEHRYRDPFGIMLLREDLREQGVEANVATLSTAFGSDRGPKTILALTGKKVDPLGWRYMDLRSDVIDLVMEEIAARPTRYQGNIGNIRIAKWLFKNHGVNINPSRIRRSFVNFKPVPGTENSSGEPAMPLQWERSYDLGYMDMGYAARVLLQNPTQYTGTLGFVRYIRSLERQLASDRQSAALAGLSFDHDEALLSPRYLYSVFGGPDLKEILQEVSEEPLSGETLSIESLGWPMWDISFDRVEKLANEIISRPEDYKHLRGMFRLAIWFEEQFGHCRMAPLFRIFGGDDVSQVLEALTGERLNTLTSLHWIYIGDPLDRIKKAVRPDEPTEQSLIDAMVGLYVNSTHQKSHEKVLKGQIHQRSS